MSRSGQSKNYFIVDDYFDKDFDLIVSRLSFKTGGVYNSEFDSVKEKIDSIKKTLDLEFFADTQGNLRLRPPKYNSMPSSVFYQMLLSSKNKGIEIFPNFISEMFESN